MPVFPPKMSEFRDLFPAPLWDTDAACSDGQSARLFFDIEGETLSERRQRELAAIAICATCPIRRACYAHADEHRIPDGIWGGFTQEARGFTRAGRPRTDGKRHPRHATEVVA